MVLCCISKFCFSLSCLWLPGAWQCDRLVLRFCFSDYGIAKYLYGFCDMKPFLHGLYWCSKVKLWNWVNDIMCNKVMIKLNVSIFLFSNFIVINFVIYYYVFKSGLLMLSVHTALLAYAGHTRLQVLQGRVLQCQ